MNGKTSIDLKSLPFVLRPSKDSKTFSSNLLYSKLGRLLLSLR